MAVTGLGQRYANTYILRVPPVRTPLRTIISVVIALAIAVSSFVYRFNTLGGALAGFDNDHFPQLVRSIAVLDGERPRIDFTDAELRSLWPAPTYSTSALAQKVFGRSLRTEALLTIGLLSIGAAAVFWVSAQFAAAIVPALVAALLAVGLQPALYNYPKIVMYALAVIAMLAYGRRQTTPRLLALGLLVALAALYRHDHGVYLGLTSGALVLLLHGRRAQRPLLILTVTCVAVLLPGIVSAQVHGGFITYLRECLELSRQEASRTTEPSEPFVVDRSQPLLLRLEPPPPPRPRIAVRWVGTLRPEMRRRAEAELELFEPVRRNDESNWSYAITSTSADHLAAIVHDSRVLDTDGIDRTRFALTELPPPPPTGWMAELRRWRVLPGVFRYDNASPWLYLVAWAVMLAVAVCVIWPPFHRAMTTPDVPLPVVRAVCVLGVLTLLVLLRNPNPSRLADVSVPVAILGSWLLTATPRAMRTSARRIRVAVAIGLILLMCVTGLAVVVLGDVEHQLDVAGIADARLARRQWNDVWRTLGALPSSLEGIDDDLAHASGYLRRCTRSTDRVFVGDSLPEIYYFAERGFAAGQVSYFSNFYSGPALQREAIDRWSRQAVPIALTQTGQRFDDEFAGDYPLLADYLRTRYRKAGSLRVERGTVLDVWIDRGRSMGTDQESGLPCDAERH